MTNTEVDPRVQPFRIVLGAEQVEDFRRRVRTTRHAAALPVDDGTTGIPADELTDLLARWAAHDWQATEDRLNALPRILTDIDGQNIHAVHVRSPHPDATPLLLMHGWPGSFLEFESLIGPLTDPPPMAETRLTHST